MVNIYVLSNLEIIYVLQMYIPHNKSLQEINYYEMFQCYILWHNIIFSEGFFTKKCQEVHKRSYLGHGGGHAPPLDPLLIGLGCHVL